VIVTSTSAAHSRALCDAVFLSFKKRKEFHTMPRVEGRTNPDWCLIDCGFLMLHIFNDATRRRYNLESLWGLRPSAEELAVSQDYEWEEDLFPEFSQAVYEAQPDEDE
jgi:ribosome-associated protein